MQIELIGCTSAGKSTLIQSILQAHPGQEIDILLGSDFVLRQVRLNWVKSHLFRKLLVNLVGLCACLVTWRKNFKFYFFATRLLFQLPIAPLVKFYSLRNVLKRIGIYEIIRLRNTDQQIILVDEGTLQTAHNLFVHESVQVKTEALSVFARLIPLPDVIVYLRQPESLLIDRTMKRGHKRIPARSHGRVGGFIKTAVATFDKLVQYPAVRNRALVVFGSQAVILVANHQNNPNLDLASTIIRSSLAVAQPADVSPVQEIIYAR